MPRAIFNINVDEVDVSNNFHPLLIALMVKLDDEGTLDEATIDLDDDGAQIGLPRMGAAISIQLGWDTTGACPVFDGFIDEVKFRLSHSTGRVLTLHAKSGDMSDKLKETACRYKDNATLQEVADDWAQKAGLSGVRIDPTLGSIKRPYWSMNSSFMEFMEGIAREVGGTFKVIGAMGVMVARTGGLSATGAALEPITATYGDNLIDISASPILSRPEYGQFAVRWYNPVEATWKQQTDGANGGVMHFHQYKAPNEAQAQAQAGSNSDEIAREKGGAEFVTIDGEPVAQPVAACTVAGTRPGVDGIYTISKVTHSLSRSGGFTTTLSLKQPSGDAGIDDRSPGEGDPNETPVTTPNSTIGGGIGGLPPTDAPAQPGGVGSA